MDNLNSTSNKDDGDDDEEEENNTNTIPSPGFLHPNDIELSVMEHDSVDDENGDDVDGPRLRRVSNGLSHADGISELFLMLVKDRHLSERRHSTRSSTTSIDSLHLKSISDKDRSVSWESFFFLNVLIL